MEWTGNTYSKEWDDCARTARSFCVQVSTPEDATTALSRNVGHQLVTRRYTSKQNCMLRDRLSREKWRSYFMFWRFRFQFWARIFSVFDCLLILLSPLRQIPELWHCRLFPDLLKLFWFLHLVVLMCLSTARCNIHNFYVLPTQCIYVFCVDLRTNSDYFTVQH
jgi:hypothetical protein